MKLWYLQHTWGFQSQRSDFAGIRRMKTLVQGGPGCGHPPLQNRPSVNTAPHPGNPLKGVFTKSSRMFQISVCEPIFEPRVLRRRLERLISRRLQASMLLMFRCSSQRSGKYTMDGSNMNLLFSIFLLAHKPPKSFQNLWRFTVLSLAILFHFLFAQLNPKRNMVVSQNRGTPI